MALREFWISVKTASGLMVPKAAVDSPRLEPDRIERILRGATLWLTPGAIKGYDSNDFDFLVEPERIKLREGVEEFKDVADALPNDAPATAEQVNAGIIGFRKILEVIRPDKYADFDAFLVGKKIENQLRSSLPDWVREMVFETGFDASGAPALWIWVEVEDEALLDRSFYNNFSQVRGMLIEAATEISPDRWTYVRMRSVSEQRPQPQRKSKARTIKK